MKKISIRLHVLVIIKKLYSILKPKKNASTLAQPIEQTALEYSKNIPLIINTRDRYDPLVHLIEWSRECGHQRILLVDNDSTNPRLMELFNDPKIQVVRLGRNAMHKAPWESMAVRFAVKNDPYLLSDPDINFTSETPKNLIPKLVSLLNKYPDINKVGVALRIDNLPDSFAQKQEVIDWESRFWSKDLEIEKDVYKADVDTTFALYRPHTWWFLSPSARVAGPYTGIHEPWYQDSSNPTADFVYYSARASRNVSTWGLGKLPKHHLKALKKEGILDILIDEED